MLRYVHLFVLFLFVSFRLYVVFTNQSTRNYEIASSCIPMHIILVWQHTFHYFFVYLLTAITAQRKFEEKIYSIYKYMKRFSRTQFPWEYRTPPSLRRTRYTYTNIIVVGINIFVTLFVALHALCVCCSRCSIFSFHTFYVFIHFFPFFFFFFRLY